MSRRSLALRGKYESWVSHRIEIGRPRLGHFKGLLWIMAHGRCLDCGERFYNRWATSKRELSRFTAPKREVLGWHFERLCRETREFARTGCRGPWRFDALREGK